MKTLSFTIDGEPFAKERHRTTKTGHTYTPEKTVNYENRVYAAFCAVKPNNWTPHDGPVLMTVRAFFAIPPSWPKWKQRAYETEATLSVHQRDYDNIEKIITDALNKIAFLDDRQVSTGGCRKYHSRRPRLEVEFTFYPKPRREQP